MTEVISNVEYSILRALGTDADFLYDTVDSYIKDAQDSNRSDLVELWQTIKQDRQKHANMLKEARNKWEEELYTDRTTSCRTGRQCKERS